MSYVLPIEQTDPELAETFRQIANKEIPFVVGNGNIYDSRTGGIAQASSDAKVNRNDKCPCDSGKKYKKCCGKQ